MRGASYSRQVEKEHPQQKHQPQQSRGKTAHYPSGNSDRGGDEGSAHKICPEEVPGNPRKHQSGHEAGIQEVLNAKDHQWRGEQNSAELGYPGQDQGRATQRQKFGSTGPRTRIVNIRDQPGKISK